MEGKLARVWAVITGTEDKPKLGILEAIRIHQGLQRPIKSIIDSNGDGVDEKTKNFVHVVASSVAVLSIRNTAASFGIPDVVSLEGKQKINKHNVVIVAVEKTHKQLRGEKESIIEKLQAEIREHEGTTRKTVEKNQVAIETTTAAMMFFQVQ